LLIRAFDPGDADRVAAMVAALNAEEGHDPRTAAGPEKLRDAFLGDGAIGALLVAGDPLAGYCTLHASFETQFGVRGAYMGDLYVAPHARRQGLGRALVAAAARHVRDAWYGEVLWWTSLPPNTRAHAFYAALGASSEPIRAFVLMPDVFARLAASA
jgi:ribosomal protein S18 acetylase RimI-like enzyme